MYLGKKVYDDEILEYLKANWSKEKQQQVVWTLQQVPCPGPTKFKLFITSGSTVRVKMKNPDYSENAEVFWMADIKDIIRNVQPQLRHAVPEVKFSCTIKPLKEGDQDFLEEKLDYSSIEEKKNILDLLAANPDADQRVDRIIITIKL